MSDGWNKRSYTEEDLEAGEFPLSSFAQTSHEMRVGQECFDDFLPDARVFCELRELKEVEYIPTSTFVCDDSESMRYPSYDEQSWWRIKFVN